MRRQSDCKVAQRCSVVSVRPHIVHVVETTGAYRPAFSQVEEHVLRGVEVVKEHKNDAIAAVTGPVLRGMGGVRYKVWLIVTPAEG
uniref:Uncharacterized protein n=1 Tax=Tanacetum cinerariifolium TaxID=118510 RepID=A0A699X9Q6_TANCI|nr:hypothetical protein [Tanacetum cinerariifolium]